MISFNIILLLIKYKNYSSLGIYNILSVQQMLKNQRQKISLIAEEYDPCVYDRPNYSQSDSESISDEQQHYQHSLNIKYNKQKGDSNEQGLKLYNQSEHNKFSQKICLNKLQACENKELVKEKRRKDKVQRATVEQVLDPRTMAILNKLVKNGTFTQVNGCISTGKQANVYHAECESSQGIKEYAIKIYKTSILVFKDRNRYVQGQFRFRRGYCSSNPRKMVKMWAEKQFRNLKRIQQILPCPVVYQVKSNVLVMQFLGKDGVPAPKLRDIEKTHEQFASIYLQLLTNMRIIYHQCKLIHADLSQYNLLYYEDKVYTIDVSQSVEHDHPHALQFLRRDIVNINDFFAKKGVRIFTQRQVFNFIVSLDIPQGKQHQALQEIIQNYDDTAARDQVFNKISMHRNLANIPMEKVEQQLFGPKKTGEQQYRHAVTGIYTVNKVQQQIEDSQISESGESSEDEPEGETEQATDDKGKQMQIGGKQKYEGLSKLQRKHKVKQQKREKRKQKMPKKQKKKLTKK